MIELFYYYFLIKRSGLFDERFYLSNYPDVRRADINALWHFVLKGWKEGRKPSTLFDTNYYLEKNPDVRRENFNPLIHYIRFGKKENRQPKPNQELQLLQIDFQAPENNQEFRFPIYSDHYNDYLPDKMEADLNLNNEKLLSIPDQSQIEFSNLQIEDPPHYEEKISVIIPTKNADNNFDFLLKMWQKQKGLKEIEIIIVDSGSIDNTIKIAKDFNVKVVEILPEEFSHSYARNLGAGNATGDFLFFTVQDALPPTDNWLYELMKIFKINDVDVVSCAEFLREDVDLLYRIISWNHYNFLDVNNNDRILSMPAKQDYTHFRKNAQISDLACLIPNSLFKKYKHKSSYAEDLELGIRLIKDGKKIAFLGNSRIIHSHNRPAFYYIKRSYVENIYMKKLFSDYDIPKVYYKDVAQDILFVFEFFHTQICQKLRELNYPVTPVTMECIINQFLQSAETFYYTNPLSSTKIPLINTFPSSFTGELTIIAGSDKVGKNYDGILIKGLRGSVDMAFNYIKNCYDLIDDHFSEEIIHCIYKLISILSGVNLSFSYINGSREVKEAMHDIHLTLIDGV